MATRHAAPLALMTWRFLIAAVAVIGIAVLYRAPWPRGWRSWWQTAAAGVFLQGLQYTGAYMGLAHGVSAPLSSLMMSTSPLLVAVGGSLLFAERLSRRQWTGLGIGLGGVGLASGEHVHAGAGWLELGFIALGLVGLSVGTLLQRRYGSSVDLRTGTAVQLTVAATISLPIALATQGLDIPLHAAVLAPLAWLALVNSVGAMLLLFWMLRRARSAVTASLFLAVPPLTALLAVPLLGQRLDPVSVVGLVICCAGVGLVRVRRIRPVALP